MNEYPPQQPSGQLPPGQYPQQPPAGYGQPPMYQPPPGAYPQQSYMPPPQPPKKKSRTGLWIGIGVALILMCMCTGFGSLASKSNTATLNNAAVTSDTATSTPAPTQKALKWTATQKFSGSGAKKTQSFTVGDNWVLQWACNPNSFYGGSYNLIVTVYGSDGSMKDLAINTICKSGNTQDQTVEHSGGTIYLDVNSEADWSLVVQEPK